MRFRSDPARSAAPRRVGVIIAALAVLMTLVAAPALAAPTIGGAVDVSYTEGDGPTPVTESVTIADGLMYGGQYLEFSIDGAVSGDTLAVATTASADITDGAVSIVGSSIYLGNGTTADVIGSVDSVLNGADGSALRVNFTSEFANAGFESGDLTGWTPITTQVDLGVTEIASCTTVDTSTYPGPVPNEDNNVPSNLGSLITPVVSDVVSEGTYALRLQSSGMTTSVGYDVVHGPAVYSGPFEAASGDTIYFDWRAYAGNDDYHVFGYIVDESCNQTELLDATGGGNTAWATNPTVIPASGTYRFVFVAGTFDASGGRAAGASLYIDNVQVFGTKANDAVAQAVARKITYEFTGEEAPESRTLNITAQSVSEGSASASLAINIDTDPATTGGVSVDTDGTSVYLTWDAPDAGGSPIVDYIIQYSNDGGATWVTFDDGVSTDTFATVTGLTIGESYIFQIAAVNGAGVGPFSSASDPQVPTATEPGVPANVAVSTGNQWAAVTWDAPDSGGSPITDYIVEWSLDGVTWTAIADGVATETSVLVEDLDNGVEYLFRVSAVNEVGTGSASTPVAGTPQSLPPFVDSTESIFAEPIQWMRDEGISLGCNPPLNSEYCPGLPLARSETAAFLDRWLDFPATAADFFGDDDGNVHEAALNRAAAAGVFRGCNPPLNDTVCPDDTITRGELAAVLVRALGLSAVAPTEFTDSSGHRFEREIGVLGGLGISLGCNPPANDLFCPDQPVTRGEMAAFLYRTAQIID